MTLVKFDPYRGFESLTRRMNKVMNEFEKGFSLETGGFNPRIDITEDENKIYVNAEVAGIAKEDVSINVNEERMLTIKGEKKREEIDKDLTFIRNERSFGNFSRSFMLPESADIENIDAKFNSGLLEVVIPKIEPEKPKEINVEIA